MFQYRPKHLNQLHSWYSQKTSKGQMGFLSFEQFEKWYSERDKECFYCGIKEEDCQFIAMTGLLKSKRFPKNGIPGQGTSRCVWLEIDRKNPNEKYSIENCELCCYFCNNDKSDVFDDNQYKEFMQNRAGFLRRLINTHRN